MVHVRAVVPTLIIVVIWVAESVPTVRLRVETPVALAVIVAPATKPVPLMVSDWLLLDPVIGFGVNDVIVGPAGGAFTVRLPVANWVFGLVTVMVQVRAVVPTLMVVVI